VESQIFSEGRQYFFVEGWIFSDRQHFFAEGRIFSPKNFFCGESAKFFCGDIEGSSPRLFFMSGSCSDFDEEILVEVFFGVTDCFGCGDSSSGGGDGLWILGFLRAGDCPMLVEFSLTSARVFQEGMGFSSLTSARLFQVGMGARGPTGTAD